MSIVTEEIQPTQSVEVILETESQDHLPETQEYLPDTQESVISSRILLPDDFVVEVYEPTPRLWTTRKPDLHAGNNGSSSTGTQSRD